jgi:hypothetical protein
MKRLALFAVFSLNACVIVDDNDDPAEVCGDGAINGVGEQCDDGNVTSPAPTASRQSAPTSRAHRTS